MEAGEQVDPLDECFGWAQLLGPVGLFGGCALWFRAREGKVWRFRLEVVEKVFEGPKPIYLVSGLARGSVVAAA